MGMSGKQACLPESLLATERPPASKQRQSRPNTRGNSAAEKNKGKLVIPADKGRCRRHDSADQGDIRMEGKKKGKPLSTALVDVVFGKLKTTVTREEEMRRKREEDMVKCGRVVRTVGPDSKQIQSTPERGSPLQESTVENDDKNSSAKESTEPSPKLTGFLISPGMSKVLDEKDLEFEELNVDDSTSAFKNYTKETGTVNVEDQMQRRSASQSTFRRATDMENQDGLNLEAFSPSLEPYQERSFVSRSPSPMMFVPEKEPVRIDGRWTASPRQGRDWQQERSTDLLQRSPPQDAYRKRHRVRSSSPRGSPSRSPVHQERQKYWRRSSDYEQPQQRSPQRSPSRIHIYQRKEAEWKRFRHYEEDYRASRCTQRSSHEGGHEEKENFQGLQIYHENSPYYESSYRQQQSFSPEVGTKYLRRNGKFQKQESPFESRKLTSDDRVFNADSGEENLKTTDLTLSSSSLDRRARRYKVAIREAQGRDREKEGKKPFYLTLNSEGKPYGPGKPAWTAEVNKLAIGLDPSCTHIKKQTHEAMCTLKDRLDDHFEYSGELNQDHLRALLGKAVTRKRTELIAMIKNNQERPKSVDKEVWLRLEKLASSTQRQKRTEIGRYANACRQTYGRTGAIGEEGVRERLAELYGRSPDPDEVAAELERPKGYTKRDLEGRRIQKTKNEVMREYESENQRERRQLVQFPVDNYRNEDPSNHNRGNISVRGEANTGNERGEGSSVPSQTMTNEEYIAKLEAEIRGLRGAEGKINSSRALVFSPCSMRRREDDSGRAVKNVARMSISKSSGYATEH